MRPGFSRTKSGITGSMDQSCDVKLTDNAIIQEEPYSDLKHVQGM